MNTQPAKPPAWIVVVEDNAADVYLLQKALQQAHVAYLMDHLTDGETAIDFFLRQSQSPGASRPHLLIIDLHLPKIDGAEVLRLLQERDVLQQVAVIVFTTSSGSHDRRAIEALPAPVDRYVVKSSNLEEFMQIGQTIKEVLAAKGV